MTASDDPGVDARERFRGCLLGGAVGDALGAAVEFLSLVQIRDRFGPGGIRDLAPAYGRVGAITDDTQMTLFTAEGLLRGHVRGLDEGIAPPLESLIGLAYGRWLLTQGVPWQGPDCRPDSSWLYGLKELHALRAPGRTCLAALQAVDKTADVAWVAHNNSKGCGGVMRVAPIGLYFARPGQPSQVELERAFDLGAKAAAVTHGHPSGQWPAAVLAAVIALLASGERLLDALWATLPLLHDHSGYQDTIVALIDAIHLADSAVDPDIAIARLGPGWVGEQALAVAVYCALRSDDFAQGVVLAVNHDGDSDSTGAIAGHLLGALHGAAAIPAPWRQQLELATAITTVADDLHDAPGWSGNPTDAFEAAAMARYPGC